MGTLTQRRISAKTAWGNLSARARRAEVFAWIGVVSFMHSQGHFPDREAALEALYSKATAADIREYRKVTGQEALE